MEFELMFIFVIKLPTVFCLVLAIYMIIKIINEKNDCILIKDLIEEEKTNSKELEQKIIRLMREAHRVDGRFQRETERFNEFMKKYREGN